MNNFKIEINKKQSIDDVNAELVRLGFERTHYTQNTSGRWLKTCDVRNCELITLSELRVLKNV